MEMISKGNPRLLKENFIQICYGFLAATTLTGCGMSMGYSAMVMPELTNNSNPDRSVFLDANTMPWFASIINIAMPIGCILNLITTKFGRRIDILSAGMMNVLGWVLIASSYNVPQLLVGRCLTGFSTGMIATPGATYLAEMSTALMGPVLTPTTCVFIAVGNLLIYLFAYIIEGWRHIAAAAIAVQVSSAIAVFLILPESPRWLISQGRAKEAKMALLTLRGLKQENSQFNAEFSEMMQYNASYCSKEDEMDVQHTDRKVASEKSTFKRISIFITTVSKTIKIPQVWKPLVILNIFFMCQQFSGTYVFIAYSVEFMSQVGIQQDPFLISIFTGLIQTIICLLMMSFSTRIGRRKMASISGSGMSLALLALALYKQVDALNTLQWLPVTAIILYTASSSLGFMTLPWAMIGELYPTKFVNYLGSFTTCACGIYNFIAVQIFPTLIAYGVHVVIYIYFFVSIVATIFIIFFLPETVGKTKEEIEKQFTANKKAGLNEVENVI